MCWTFHDWRICVVFTLWTPLDRHDPSLCLQLIHSPRRRLDFPAALKLPPEVYQRCSEISSSQHLKLSHRWWCGESAHDSPTWRAVWMGLVFPLSIEMITQTSIKMFLHVSCIQYGWPNLSKRLRFLTISTATSVVLCKNRAVNDLWTIIPAFHYSCNVCFCLPLFPLLLSHSFKGKKRKIMSWYLLIVIKGKLHLKRQCKAGAMIMKNSIYIAKP